MVRLSRGERKRIARERVEREEREESLRRKQKYRYYFVYEQYWEYEQDFEYEYTEYRYGSYRSAYEEANSSNYNRQKPSSTKRKKDYYKILDVTKNATMVQIKTAYKQKALLYHPDRFPNATDAEKKTAEENFKLIGEAYSILMDVNKREKYDNGNGDE